MTGEKISFKASFECFKGWRLPDMKGQRIPDRKSSNPPCPRSNGSFYNIDTVVSLRTRDGLGTLDIRLWLTNFGTF